MKIISITGTKGKTTITRAISYTLKNYGENTLRVDTDGHYVNEKQKSTLLESKQIFGLVPTVCPGKYLLTMKKYYPNYTAILETAIGSSGRGGLGYRKHNIGIFSNVFEDHLGASKRLKTRKDISKAKNFIFSAIGGENGYAVFNADDNLVCSQLNCISTKRKVTLVPVGYNLNFFNTKKHLDNNGIVITKKDNYLILKSKNKTINLLDIRDIDWTFKGNFNPSIYNLMLILGGLYSFNEGNLPKIKKCITVLKNYKPEKHGGRLTLLENKQGVKIMVDYAHEKYSLNEVATLAKKNSNGKTIGVVRLAPDRTDKMIIETGQFIADSFDSFIIYDKIDGISKKRYISTGLTPTREKGDVSKLFLQGILSKKSKKNAVRIIIEENAIKKAAEIANPGDTVVIICGDDHKKTIDYIKKYFKASFVK